MRRIPLDPLANQPRVWACALALMGLALGLSLLIPTGKTKWQFTASLPTPCAMEYSTVQADGRVLYSTQYPELYDPKTNLWVAEFPVSGNLVPSSFEWPSETSADERRFERQIMEFNTRHGFLGNDAEQVRNSITLKSGQVIIFAYGCLLLSDPSLHQLKNIQSKSSLNGSIFNFVSLPDSRFFISRCRGNDFNSPSEAIYDPKTDRWSSIDDPAIGIGQTATLLPDGKILLIGGAMVQPRSFLSRTFQSVKVWWDPTLPVDAEVTYIIVPTCRIYDPVANTWRITEPLNTARAFHSANLLNDGRVLVSGGHTKPEAAQLTNTCEIILVKDIDP